MASELPKAEGSDRPWPVPEHPWTMAMVWYDLAFLHWPLPAEQIRPLVPGELEIDTFDGTAWLGIVPFAMRGIRHRLVPPLPGVRRFPELNVRTYVRREGKPGVWFFSLDAHHRLAVAVARRTFHLPYYYAQMSLREDGAAVHYASRRHHRGGGEAEFLGWYQPSGSAYQAKAGELDHFLTARYCLYAADGRGRVFRGNIDHPPWQLQPAEARIDRNSMTDPIGLKLPDVPPLVHFVRSIDTVAWRLSP